MKTAEEYAKDIRRHPAISRSTAKTIVRTAQMEAWDAALDAVLTECPAVFHSAVSSALARLKGKCP